MRGLAGTERTILGDPHNLRRIGEPMFETPTTVALTRALAARWLASQISETFWLDTPVDPD
jgi:hypothetical protein